MNFLFFPFSVFVHLIDSIIKVLKRLPPPFLYRFRSPKKLASGDCAHHECRSPPRERSRKRETVGEKPLFLGAAIHFEFVARSVRLFGSVRISEWVWVLTEYWVLPSSEYRVLSDLVRRRRVSRCWDNIMLMWKVHSPKKATKVRSIKCAKSKM